MAKYRMDVLALLRKEAPDADLDFLREGLRVLMRAVMEAEVVNKTGAGLGERSPERITHRNGYRDRPWDTQVGTLELQVPKVREGSYFPSPPSPWATGGRSGRTTCRSASTWWASSRTRLRSGGSSGQSWPSSMMSGRSPAAICPLLPSTSAISTAWRHQ